jgi:hypothetical protein
VQTIAWLHGKNDFCFVNMRYKKLENKLVQLEQQTFALNISKPVSTDTFSNRIHV